MSKDLFTQMREQEVSTLNFLPTKKEIHLSVKKFVDKIVEDGEENIYEKYAEAIRLKEAISIIEQELKTKLHQESFESFGVKGTFRNGGSLANYEEDITYSQIKKQLDSRKLLLDTALKTDEILYDSEGVEVPRVSKTERKSSLVITF